MWPENTLHAFEGAAALGADVIETDVRSTSDGVLVVFHDATVERTTDGVGSVARMTLAELKRLDAGYRWSPDGGRTFPLRGRGLSVPTLEEVFERLPGMRFNVEPKRDADASSQALCWRDSRARVGGECWSLRSAVALEEFRRVCPEVATLGQPPRRPRTFSRLQRVRRLYSPLMGRYRFRNTRGLKGSTKGLSRRARRQPRGARVDGQRHGGQRRLDGDGVDGIMTDYPDRLLEILGRALPR